MSWSHAFLLLIGCIRSLPAHLWGTYLSCLLIHICLSWKLCSHGRCLPSLTNQSLTFCFLTVFQISSLSSCPLVQAFSCTHVPTRNQTSLYLLSFLMVSFYSFKDLFSASSLFPGFALAPLFLCSGQVPVPLFCRITALLFLSTLNPLYRTLL